MSLDNYVPQLSRPTTVEQLARSLGIATEIFIHIAECTKPETIYRRHLIPKRSARAVPSVPIEDGAGLVELSLGSFQLENYRVVWEAEDLVIKNSHKSAARILQRFFCRPGTQFPHEAAYGYVKGRSTRANARQHIGARHLLSADIKHFFPSITQARVEISLRDSGIHQNVAGALARFLTIQGSLPLGLNASPMIANLVATPLDHEMGRLAKEGGFRYSRYADDITLSGDSELPPREVIESVLKRHFFRLNQSKFRVSKLGQKHYITGLSVADKAAPHVPRALKNRLRQELYYIEKFGLGEHLARIKSKRTTQHEINRLDGTVNYVSSIEPRMARGLHVAWNAIVQRHGVSRSFEPRPAITLRQASWFVDEAEIMHPDGTRLLAVCVAHVLDPGRLGGQILGLMAHEAGDAFGASDPGAIGKKGLHWADATWSQREALVKILAVAPIRAIVAIVPIHDPSKYSAIYGQLLGRILDVLLRSSDDAEVTLFIEENRSKVSERDVRQTVATTYLELEKANRRRPLRSPQVKILPKAAEACSCVPDVLLGVMHRYATSRAASQEGALPVSLFERLRNRYAVIFDAHANQVYHSRNAFVRW